MRANLSLDWAMSDLEIESIPSLRKPVLIAAFGGWNDAGQAATAAIRFLGERWEAVRFASIDAEEYFDFTSARPLIRLGPGLERELEWPANVFFYHALPDQSRDAILLLGTEPHLKWLAFTDTVLRLARQCGVELVVTMGAFLGEAVHSRPVPMIGFANRPELSRRLVELGVSPSRYEGPTGIVGALHDACRRQAMAAASVWAASPHYLATTMNPKASMALLQCLNDFLGLGIDLGEIKRAAARFEAQVEEALEANPELAAYLQQLEQRLDTAGEPEPRTLADGPELPPGEAVVEELEKFLREKRQEGEEE
jgi:proteasome assembly chaperone (PAC2) family protein